MNNNRRTFLKNGSLLATSFLLGKQFSSAEPVTNYFSKHVEGMRELPIFYTGDIQGRIQPFSYGRLNNIGGIKNILKVLKKNSISNPLFDAGDFLGSKASFDED